MNGMKCFVWSYRTVLVLKNRFLIKLNLCDASLLMFSSLVFFVGVRAVAQGNVYLVCKPNKGPSFEVGFLREKN